MCNDYEQHIRYAEYCRMMQALELGMPEHRSEADLPQADDIKIGDIGPVMRASGNVIELTQMKFGFPPEGRGGPVFNFRSEARDFPTANVASFRLARSSNSRARNFPRPNIASRWLNIR